MPAVTVDASALRGGVCAAVYDAASSRISAVARSVPIGIHLSVEAAVAPARSTPRMTDGADRGVRCPCTRTRRGRLRTTRRFHRGRAAPCVPPRTWQGPPATDDRYWR